MVCAARLKPFRDEEEKEEKEEKEEEEEERKRRKGRAQHSAPLQRKRQILHTLCPRERNISASLDVDLGRPYTTS
jgi:hypothetical protein